MRRGAGFDFAEAMRTEFRIVSRVARGHDFYEGVRAVVIDKDHAPRWQPATLEAVDPAAIAAYFAAARRGRTRAGVAELEPRRRWRSRRSARRRAPATVGESRRRRAGGRVLVWLLRLLSVFWMAKGLMAWAVIFGLAGDGQPPFEARLLSFQAITVYFAVIDLVAAVGLWLTSTWGGVLWLLAAIEPAAARLLLPAAAADDALAAGAYVALIARLFPGDLGRGERGQLSAAMLDCAEVHGNKRFSLSVSGFILHLPKGVNLRIHPDI